MASANRSCFVCGKRYYHCTSSNCAESKGHPEWMIMFDEENCFNIWNILSDRFFKKLSDKEAYDKLQKCDLSHKDEFNAEIIKDIDEIFASQKKESVKRTPKK